MPLTAQALTIEGLFVLPALAPLGVGWVTLYSNADSSVQMRQGISGAAAVDTGTAWPAVQLAFGDTLIAITHDTSSAAGVLRTVVRVPYQGLAFSAGRFAIGGNVGSWGFGVLGLNAGEVLIAVNSLRGQCSSGTGSAAATWNGGNAIPGFPPQPASVTGVAAGAGGDAVGNVVAASAGVIVEAGTWNGLGFTSSTLGPCDLAAQNKRVDACLILSSAPLASAFRIRSHLSEDAGSLFAATQAVAVELGISEAFDYGEDVRAGVLRPFSEALTPELVALRYYPLPTRNQEMLVTVDGETNLGRMASTIPDALMLPASSIPGESGGVVTAQQAIQYVVDTWASAYPWLVFEPVPDLRLVEPGAVGNERQFYIDNASAGVLTTAAVVIPQEQDARRSMREILDEWLSIFPGTIVRQTSLGTIELVPRVGPDAPDDVAVTLTWDDLLRISDGEDDPRGVINRCRVTSQGWEFTENQALRSPAFVVSIGGMGIERSVLDSEEVLPGDSAEEFQPGRTIPFTVLVDGGNTITVDVVLTAFGSWNRSTASAFGTEGTHSASLTLSVGQSQLVSITHNSRSQNVTATWRVTRVSSVAIDVEPLTIPSWADNFFGRTYFAYLFEVDVTGTAWVRTNEAVTSEFGRADQVLPGPGGTDALVTSRAAYGERQASIQSNVFQLTLEQAQNIAQSYVLWNINPRTIRDVQQSEWDRYRVKFDHIGRLIELPNGEVAVVENRDYTDAFQPLGGAMSSTFSATVTEVVIDTETDWLLLDSGGFLQLDSGEMVEVS